MDNASAPSCSGIESGTPLITDRINGSSTRDHAAQMWSEEWLEERLEEWLEERLEEWRTHLRATPCAGRKEIPATTAWRDLWNSPTQYLWLRRHGLPAASPGAEDGNFDPAHPGVPNTFVLPLVRTCRGEQLHLPTKILPRAPGVHPGFLPPGLRRRATAISHCLAQAIDTPGVIAAEFMVQPEESVLITRVLSFPWLIEHAADRQTRDALARIHLCAILDRPLPCSID